VKFWREVSGDAAPGRRPHERGASDVRSSCWLSVLLAVLSLVVLFGPHEVGADDGSVAGQKDERELVTSRSGPLQRRLAEAFPEAFVDGIDILWEPRDGWVSPEIFDWWSLRVAEEDRSGLDGEAADRMFSRIARQDPVFRKPDERRLCAVVGASRNLLGSGYGKIIDAHDVIFRVNRAPTGDYDSDVGDRTTHHVMWPRELEHGQYNPHSFLLMTPVAVNNPNVLDRIVWLADQQLGWDLERVRIIHPAFVKYVHERWTGIHGAYPSTGFLALMLALHVCDEVDVFGFGADAAGRWDRYYENVVEDVRQFHPADAEGRLRQEMEEKGLLKVYRGSRP
jgi:beta-galactoside alpha-2,3-sialyltransferase (sialyltransferase 4B)